MCNGLIILLYITISLFVHALLSNISVAMSPFHSKIIVLFDMKCISGFRAGRPGQPPEAPATGGCRGINGSAPTSLT